MKTPWKMTMAAFMLSTSLYAYPTYDQSPKQLLSRTPASEVVTQQEDSLISFLELKEADQLQKKHDDINASLTTLERNINSLTLSEDKESNELIKKKLDDLEFQRLTILNVTKKYNESLAANTSLSEEENLSLATNFLALTTRSEDLFSSVISIKDTYASDDTQEEVEKEEITTQPAIVLNPLDALGKNTTLTDYDVKEVTATISAPIKDLLEKGIDVEKKAASADENNSEEVSDDFEVTSVDGEDSYKRTLSNSTESEDEMKENKKRIASAKKELKKKGLKKDAIRKTFKKLEKHSDKLVLTLKIKATDKLNQDKIDSKKNKVQETKEKVELLIAEAKAILEMIEDGRTDKFKAREVKKLKKELAKFEELMKDINSAESTLIAADKKLDEDCTTCGTPETIADLDKKVGNRIDKLTDIIEELVDDRNEGEDDDKTANSSNDESNQEFKERIAKEYEDFKKDMFDRYMMTSFMSQMGGQQVVPQMQMPQWGDRAIDYSRFSPFYELQQKGTSMLDLFSFGNTLNLGNFLKNGQGVTVNNYNSPQSSYYGQNNAQRNPSYYNGANTNGTGLKFGEFAPVNLNAREIK